MLQIQHVQSKEEISFNEGGTSGVMIATYASASDTTIANWFAAGSDIFANFSYITA